MRYIIPLFVFSSCIFILFDCDHGLAPADSETKTGIAGTITYEDNWPSADSLKNLRLVVFKKYPPTDIIVEILTGEAFVYPPIDTISLAFNVTSQEYMLELPSGTFEYVAVAQQYGDNIFSDWRAVGQYDTDSDSLPTPILLEKNTFLENIDINVDFENLPIQPF
jgi:hypothetical protein